jgi:hypothetical protein
LIQKPQIYIFVKNLDLSKFENVYSLYINFEFDFKSAEKRISNTFFIILHEPASSAFSPLAGPLAHHPVPSFYLQQVAPPPRCSPVPSEAMLSCTASTLTPSYAPPAPLP